jgi:hypothetical protein
MIEYICWFAAGMVSVFALCGAWRIVEFLVEPTE